MPSGRDFTAQPSRPIEATRLTAVSTVGMGRVKPCVNFRPTAQPISNRPATKRMIQAMTGSQT
ncbi:hypothetical protein ASD89_20410 [Caulobacter sp. Root656]|nr:hypothetical protein ASD89_20410 [Caulobacter sp. Root656]